MATRPGPLRDILLDHERLKLHSDDHIASPFKSSNKRLPSPGSNAICSPPKRRSIEPQSTNAIRHTSTPHQAQVRAILHGPNSPARRLDFGVAHSYAKDDDDNMMTDPEPVHRTRSVAHGLKSIVAHSPLLPSFDAPTSSLKEPFSGFPPLITLPMDSTMADHTDSQTPTSPASHEGCAPDRTSVHYPGFDVYQDPVWNLHTLPQMPLLSSLTMDDNGDGNMEEDKENIRPARHAKLCFGEAAWAKAGLLCPREVDMLCSPVRLSTPSVLASTLEVSVSTASVEEEREGGDSDTGMDLGTPRTPRRIRDIGNINVQPLALHGKMTLTSNSFHVLDGDKGKEKSRRRGDVDDRMMEVENEYEQENERCD